MRYPTPMSRHNKLIRVTLTLPQDLVEWIDAQCDDRPRSAVVRRLLAKARADAVKAVSDE
jgi:hypothetical protein